LRQRLSQRLIDAAALHLRRSSLRIAPLNTPMKIFAKNDFH
jgi:hypothetical protein